MSSKKVDEQAAQSSFERALNEHEQQFGTFFLAKLLGLEFAYFDDRCEITFEPKDFVFNPQGSLHGGIIASIMDISMGHLLKKTRGPGVTLEIKVQYFKAITTGKARCVGRFLKQGKTIVFLQSELFDASGELCACATSTWKLL